MPGTPVREKRNSGGKKMTLDSKTLIEAIGYTGSLIVVASMLMTSVMKLRIVNTIGSVIFTVYAFIIRSYPTAFMNLCLVAINLWQMAKLSNTERNYDLVEAEPDESILLYLLKNYAEDIRKYFPDAEQQIGRADMACLVTCGNTPAGIFLARKTEENLEVLMDYSLPVYRDCSVGRYLYGELEKRGVKELRCETKVKAHADYLRKLGSLEETSDKFVRKFSQK